MIIVIFRLKSEHLNTFLVEIAEFVMMIFLTRYTSKIPNKNEGLWKLFSFSRTLNLLNNIIFKKDQFSTQTCNLHFTIAFCSKRLVYDLWWEIAHTKNSSLALGIHKTYQMKNIPRQYIHLIWHNLAFKFIRQKTCLNYRFKKKYCR